MNIKDQIYAVINRRYNENLNTTKVLEEKCGESSVAAALFGAAAKEDYELLSFLDSLPEQPVAWSEEDCIIRRALIDTLQGETTCFTTNDFISWLKSIRPSWKPSKEQMEALDMAQGKMCQTEYNDALCSLIDNLQKL